MEVVKKVARRHLKGALRWFVLFDELNVPRPRGKPGDPPLRAAELPHFLAPLHTGLGEVRLTMGEDAATVVVLQSTSAA